MAKTCLNKIAGNILTTCELPVNKVRDLYLMHVEDVTLAFNASGLLTEAAFSSGARSYKIEGYKQNIQITSAVRSLDASNKLDISVSFKIPKNKLGHYSTDLVTTNALLTGRFYVLCENGIDDYFFLGDISPLECSAFDWDSNANGQLATVTLSAPDGSAGNYFRCMAASARANIISKAS